MIGPERLAASLISDRPSVVPYLTAGYPEMDRFVGWIDELSMVSPAVEIGIPFSDPMADGTTIQESSAAALRNGTTLSGVLDALGNRRSDTPLVVMSYVNPLLAFGLDRLMPRLSDVGVCGLVVPDLPLEEAAPVVEAATSASIGMVQLVTPLTDPDRLVTLCAASQGFVYAVTMTGTTGGTVADGAAVSDYLDRVVDCSSVPVLAGFGVRTGEQVESLSAHCDGVIVGSAIIEEIAQGRDPVAYVSGLKT